MQTLIQNDKKRQAEGEQTVEPTRIDVQPPSSPGGLAWIMILLPTGVVLGFDHGPCSPGDAEGWRPSLWRNAGKA